MKLEGVHHVTAITGEAPGNVDFYTRVLGLRLVKKSVNQDDPTVYHLFYGDEEGAPGNDITFFEYPGARPGSAGAGMVHRVVWRIGSDDALSFWEERLGKEGVQTERGEDGSLLFSDPEGLAHELVVSQVADEPLIADHPEIPAEQALQGFEGVRAYTHDPEASRATQQRAVPLVGERGKGLLDREPAQLVDLVGRSETAAQRAQALIAIAHPDFREDLERQAYENRLIPRGVSFSCRSNASDDCGKVQHLR